MYQLTKQSYNTLKSVDLSELGENITFDDDSNVVYVADKKLLLIMLNEEIAVNGLSEDQNFVNAYGRDLYALYDELLQQD